MFAYLNHWLPILVKNTFSNSNDEVAGEPEKDNKSGSGDDLSDEKEASASERSDREVFTERKTETSSSKGHICTEQEKLRLKRAYDLCRAWVVC